jgi:hypothetical protein
MKAEAARAIPREVAWPLSLAGTTSAGKRAPRILSFYVGRAADVSANDL